MTGAFVKPSMCIQLKPRSSPSSTVWSAVIQFRPLSSSLWFSPTLADIPTQSHSSLICLYLCIFFPAFPLFLHRLLSFFSLPLYHAPDKVVGSSSSGPFNLKQMIRVILQDKCNFSGRSKSVQAHLIVSIIVGPDGGLGPFLQSGPLITLATMRSRC